MKLYRLFWKQLLQTSSSLTVAQILALIKKLEAKQTKESRLIVWSLKLHLLDHIQPILSIILYHQTCNFLTTKQKHFLKTYLKKPIKLTMIWPPSTRL